MHSQPDSEMLLVVTLKEQPEITLTAGEENMKIIRVSKLKKKWSQETCRMNICDFRKNGDFPFFKNATSEKMGISHFLFRALGSLHR